MPFAGEEPPGVQFEEVPPEVIVGPLIRSRETCVGIPQCGIEARNYRPGMCQIDGCPRLAAAHEVCI